MAKASDLETMLGVKPFIWLSKNRTTKTEVIRICRGNSFLTVFCFTVKLLIKTATPSMSRPLVMLLPITFPNTISVLPTDRAFRETANSGALVPKATMVKPISILDTLKFWAVEEAPSTKMSAPLINRTKPIINKII